MSCCLQRGGVGRSPIRPAAMTPTTPAVRMPETIVNRTRRATMGVISLGIECESVLEHEADHSRRHERRDLDWRLSELHRSITFASRGRDGTVTDSNVQKIVQTLFLFLTSHSSRPMIVHESVHCRLWFIGRAIHIRLSRILEELRQTHVKGYPFAGLRSESQVQSVSIRRCVARRTQPGFSAEKRTLPTYRRSRSITDHGDRSALFIGGLGA